jgi:hypothetical protein
MESIERKTLTRITNYLPNISSFDDVIIAITKLFFWVLIALAVAGSTILLAKFVKYAIIQSIMNF